MTDQLKLVILDVDGTAVKTKSGKVFRTSADDWEWVPGCKAKILELVAQGLNVAFATNQGGVAFGYLDPVEMSRELHRMAEEVGVSKDRVYICFNHPGASIEDYKCDDDRRKPKSGMLIEARLDVNAMPEETLVVGDRAEDQKAAEHDGCHFCWASEWCL